ncbi:MAG TPA: SpoIVB peptidase S55 domain-containing protein [Polyangiales bacterium]|nr:SpoIVB peptidase S55 domain-containing protein [Polyangiales bacterium]
MSRVPLSLFVLAVAALCLTSALALSQVRPYMDVSEIKPGMQGYGLTVFRGNTPERFGVSVIDVLRQFRPGQDLVLIRTEHPLLEKAVTVAGMSGSPIYLNDRLIGAYAYGWTFGKEPIAGVTPISNMLAELTRPIDPQIWKAVGTLPALVAPPPSKAKPAAPRTQRSGSSRVFSALPELQDAPSTAYGVPLPAATPLLLSGLGPRSAALLERELEPFGLVPVQGSGGSAGPAVPAAVSSKFVDGGSIGVQLMRGDISMMGTGTVTHVAGQKLVAFGHPMLNAGQVAMATCHARVVHIVQSTVRSFKLAEPAGPLGVLVNDRQAAIVVDQSLRAELVPVKLKVHGLQGAPRDEWNVEVAAHRMLTPGLVLAALNNALEATAIDRTDAVLKIDSQLEIAGHGTHKTHDVLFTQAGAADGGALSHLRLFTGLNAAYLNPFENARVTRVQVDLHVSYERDVLSIIDAQLPSDEIDPDSTVQLTVTLRRFDESEQQKLIPLHIPKSAAGETLELTIEPGDEVALDYPKPSSLDDMLRTLRDSYSGMSLVVSTKLPEHGVKLRGQLVRSLPDSMLDTFQPANQSERGSLFSIYERKELPLGHAVTGSARLKLQVRDEPLR